MGYTRITVSMPTDYTEPQLQRTIEKKLRTHIESYHIEQKSLDARKKSQIRWSIRILAYTKRHNTTDIIPQAPSPLLIPQTRRPKNCVVVGSGPAGMFAALALQIAGHSVTLIERGEDVAARAKAIELFESCGSFSPNSNYAFGEGGAGTFSDGKLTSRTGKISSERDFILQTYIEAGAPKEIEYLNHPHLGSDTLKIIVQNLRKKFETLGGRMYFNTCLKDIHVQGESVTSAETSDGQLPVDFLLIAPGHSAYETYRMLMHRGVHFRTKNFAIGTRVEHPQTLINLAQWGREHLPGVKAAEYRLTAPEAGEFPVYTFCMCPGGIVVPATAYEEANIVNGMSLYARNGAFANAACVAGLNLQQLHNREFSAEEALDWLEKLEQQFKEITGDFRAPYCTIEEFLKKGTGRVSARGKAVETSYPLGLDHQPLWELLPSALIPSLQAGLTRFCSQLAGFESGIMLGLESKTSSPIQVIREHNGLCAGFSNLAIAGEGSGYAGGIISSGADGLRIAMEFIKETS